VWIAVEQMSACQICLATRFATESNLADEKEKFAELILELDQLGIVVELYSKHAQCK
jgi:hypothetical protein